MKKEANILKSWSANFKNTDPFLIQLTLALTVIGFIFAVTSSTYESYRITNNFWTLGIKQFIALILGLTLLFTLWSLNYRFWYKATWPFSIIMLITMLFTVFLGLGKISGGSRRWIDIGFFQFQPAELAKFAVVLLITRFLCRHKWFEFKSYYYLGFCLILILAILKQPDLGSAGILILLLLEMVFVFGWPIWILLPSIFLSSIASYFTLPKILSSYQLDRIKFWLNPYLEPQGRGYNLIQAKYAFGFGGIFGAGLGNSVQKQGFLPVPHSDFIFAVIAEEIGFIGITIILTLFITWILRGFYLLNKVENVYGKVLGSAIIFLITTQTIVNIGVNIGLLPVTGVTLPFFSCGGTSLIVILAMCGILLNITSTGKQTR